MLIKVLCRSVLQVKLDEMTDFITKAGAGFAILTVAVLCVRMWLAVSMCICVHVCIYKFVLVQWCRAHLAARGYWMKALHDAALPQPIRQLMNQSLDDILE